MPMELKLIMTQKETLINDVHGKIGCLSHKLSRKEECLLILTQFLTLMFPKTWCLCHHSLTYYLPLPTN